jgi:hypothetical protein
MYKRITFSEMEWKIKVFLSLSLFANLGWGWKYVSERCEINE